MTAQKPPRQVAMALIFAQKTQRLLMITSRKHPHLWILPKGGIEEGETSGEAAVRESWEEAGTPKDLPPPTDEQRVMMLALEPVNPGKRGAVWHIQVVEVEEADVEVVADWPERLEREREWVTATECLRRVRAWYTDEAARAEVEGETTASVDEDKRRAKKAAKGGAMEQSLRVFAEQKGLALA